MITHKVALVYEVMPAILDNKANETEHSSTIIATWRASKNTLIQGLIYLSTTLLFLRAI